jgi:uncharacterized protein (AIM24 family)
VADREQTAAFPESSTRSPGAESPIGAALKRASELITNHHLEEAEEALQAAREGAAPDARVLALVALVHFKQGRLLQAFQDYREATDLDPGDPSLRLNLGLVSLKLERYKEAIATLEIAVTLRPDDRRAYGYLGYAFARQGARSQAAAAFRRAGQHELAAEMERDAGFDPVDPPPMLTPPIQPTSAPLPEPRDSLAQGLPLPVEKTPVPTPAKGVRFSLGEFIGQRTMSLGPATQVAEPLEMRGLRFAVSEGAYVRESALLVAHGGHAMRLARRRIRGSLADQYVMATGDRFLQLTGHGDVWLAPPEAGKDLMCLSLDKDVIYLDEARVMAFSESVLFEVGRLPGRGNPLLQLRGSGQVVLACGQDEMVAVQVKEGDSLVVSLPRIAGWIGRVVVQGEVSAEMQGGVLRYVTCEGEGVLLLSRHAEPR